MKPRPGAKKYRDTASEHSLQATVIDYLKLHGRYEMFWFSIPNAGRRGHWVAQQMKAEGLTAGAPDLCILLPQGRVLWLELKTATGRQSPAQLAFQSFCYAQGHIYRVIRSVDDVTALLIQHGILKGPP